MNTDLKPLASFLERMEADKAKHMLEAAGIMATVRSVHDMPRGYQTLQKEGFMLWVNESEWQQATEVYQQLVMEASPPLMCERCGRNHATVHITTISGGHRVTEHICNECHSTGQQP